MNEPECVAGCIRCDDLKRLTMRARSAKDPTKEADYLALSRRHLSAGHGIGSVVAK